MKRIVVYYSQTQGNTKRISEMIRKELDTDIERIETVTPYTGSYNKIVEQGQREVQEGYMPDIQPLSCDLTGYDEVIIGMPTWWYTMAPAVKTFFSQNDLSGKKVVLFQTHGGWPAHALKDMKKACAGADIVSTFAVQFDSNGGDHLETGEKEIENWIDSLK